MIISYNKLRKLLSDKNMTEAELKAKAHIAKPTIEKLNNNRQIDTEILLKICKALNCNLGDIMEIKR